LAVVVTVVVAEMMFGLVVVLLLTPNFNVITPATEATMTATTRIAAETAVEIPFLLFPSIVSTTFLLAIFGRGVSDVPHQKGDKIKMKQ
jgi:hypothetical protein